MLLTSRIATRLALVLVALTACAQPTLASPVTLACTEAYSLNWRAEAPELISTVPDDELGGMTIHLDPASGEWFLSMAGSAALTSDGGTFEVRRESEFTAYHHEWVGIDHDTMLRIWGGGTAPLRFSFISRDYSLVVGECAEPDETFIVLRGAGE